MTDQVFSDLPQTPLPEPPADALAQKEPPKALIPAREMADALSAPEPETPDVSDSPFCRAMGLIAGGLAVTGVTLNFWNLDMLLPLVGTFCLLVGFRALRRVNGFLRAGFTCACLRVLLLFVELGQNAVIYHADTGPAALFSVIVEVGGRQRPASVALRRFCAADDRAVAVGMQLGVQRGEQQLALV